MPYSTNVSGTTITAAWGNANVRDQVVTPFASAAARTSAITSPIQGMISTRTDENVAELYTGSAWVPVGWVPIASTTLGGTASSVTFSSIPATYRNLLLVVLARGDAVATAIDVNLRFNNASTADYSWESWVCNQGDVSVSASTSNSATSIQTTRVPAASFGNSSSFGGGMIEILGYANTNVATKQIRAWGKVGDFGNGSHSRWRFGAWGASGASGVAVNRIDLLTSSGNFVANSTFQLYGLGA